MSLFQNFNRIMFSSGLTKKEYAMIAEKLNEDNREKLASFTLIASAIFVVLLGLSFLLESIAHARPAYICALAASLFLFTFSQLGKIHYNWSCYGIYFFASASFMFGIYQGLVTSPEEQTASLMALLLAVPLWFTMLPYRMVTFIYFFTIVFIVGCLKIKTGPIQTADIVNVLIYSNISAIISTYTTCIKCKRLLAEHITDRMSKTDTLTGLGNRSAFTMHAMQYSETPLPDTLTLICLDVNELKAINDTMGHHVGDELLCGAAECISSVFNSVGTCYRTGGDEFFVLGRIDRDQLDTIRRKFDRTVKEWKGSWGRPLRISYGFASAWELPGEPLAHLSKLADRRLYEAKNIYYSTSGLDRQGYREAYAALCESYMEILRVDLTKDTCRIIRAQDYDARCRNDASISFSGWLKHICESGQVHPDDLAEYAAMTDLPLLRESFRSGKHSIHVFCRRKSNGEFRSVMTELIRASDYTDEEQVIYFYVKNIDRMG